MRRIRRDADDRIDHFPGRQVAHKTHPPGGAEGAAQRASDLRAQADDKLLFPGPVHQRNRHRLERFRSVALEEILGESIPRGDDLVSQDQPRQDDFSPNLRQQLIRYFRKALGKRVAPQHRRLQPPRQTHRNAQRRKLSMQFRRGGVFEKDRHGAEADCTAIPIPKPAFLSRSGGRAQVRTRERGEGRHRGPMRRPEAPQEASRPDRPGGRLRRLIPGLTRGAPERNSQAIRAPRLLIPARFVIAIGAACEVSELFLTSGEDKSSIKIK